MSDFNHQGERGPVGDLGPRGSQGPPGPAGASTPVWVKILISASITLAIALGGASWSQAINNEHRLTAIESAVSYLAKSVDASLARQLLVEEKYDRMLATLGRIEGELAERNRTEAIVALPGKPKK